MLTPGGTKRLAQRVGVVLTAGSPSTPPRPRRTAVSRSGTNRIDELRLVVEDEQCRGPPAYPATSTAGSVSPCEQFDQAPERRSMRGVILSFLARDRAEARARPGHVDIVEVAEIQRDVAVVVGCAGPRLPSWHKAKSSSPAIRKPPPSRSAAAAMSPDRAERGQPPAARSMGVRLGHGRQRAGGRIAPWSYWPQADDRVIREEAVHAVFELGEPVAVRRPGRERAPTSPRRWADRPGVTPRPAPWRCFVPPALDLRHSASKSPSGIYASPIRRTTSCPALERRNRPSGIAKREARRRSYRDPRDRPC